MRDPVLLLRSLESSALIRGGSNAIAARRLASYRKRTEEKEEKEEKRGHNHPFNEKCGPHCPRNEHYKGPVRKPDLLRRKKRQ